MERITDFRTRLSAQISRNFVDDIVRSVQDHPEDFTGLYSLIKEDSVNISWRSAWACEKLCKAHPEWFVPRYKELTEYAMECRHDGKKRILLAILYQLPLPGELPLQLYDFCIRRMLATEESIAVQSLCIKLAFKIGRSQPDLLYEMQLYLDNAQTEYFSTAVKSTIKNIRKKILCTKTKKNY